MQVKFLLGHEFIDNCNEVRRRRKEEPQAQLPVRFHLDSIDNKLLQHACLPQGRA